MTNPDPKPGRWILPVLVAALVGLTYAFVTNVPQSPATVSTTIGAGGSTATSSTTTSAAVEEGDTTTTTLDPEVAEFVDASNNLSTLAGELADKASSINASWDSETTDYGDTRDALRDLASETRQFATAAGITDRPSDVEDAWTEVTDAADRMATAADDMLDGLVNSPGPEKRQASLTTYGEAASELQDAIVTAQETADGG